MFRNIFTAALCVGALQFGAAHASTVSAESVGLGVGLPSTLANGAVVDTFDFGGITGRIEVTNGFGNRATAGEGRVFDTTLSGTRDPDLEAPFFDATGTITGGVAFGNALIIQELAQMSNAAPDDEAAGGTIVFLFDRVVNVSGITFLDGEEGADILVDGVEIGGFASGTATNNEFTRVDLADAMGIRELTVRLNGSGAIGALSIAPVPVPASLPLLLAGMGAFAMVKRRRKAA